jgi:hypothetical protein
LDLLDRLWWGIVNCFLKGSGIRREDSTFLVIFKEEHEKKAGKMGVG